jgi:hypothetical protein
MSSLVLVDLDWVQYSFKDEEVVAKLICLIEKEFDIQFGMNKLFVTSNNKNTQLSEFKRVDIDYNEFDVE